MTSKRVTELPKQEFEEIRRTILAKCAPSERAGLKLAFLDLTFPPDQSSLSYVYSGDDKYERMVFRRPHEISQCPYLIGTGGICDIRVPMSRWNGRQWLLHAMTVISLNPRFFDKLVPGYRSFTQGFSRGYTGAFRFSLWRFGEWVEVVVDDSLPMLDGELAFCPALGRPAEFWAPLLEKAYAKCNKAYEAVEVGNVLNALTDFTGTVCEHYSPDQGAPANLFHVLYKSSINQSLIVAWRNARSFREAGFRPGLNLPLDGARGYKTKEEAKPYMSDQPTSQNLFLVTASTKVPLRDGQMLEIVRIKCPYESRASWRGAFASCHDASWIAVNPTFLANYRPRDCLEPNESWISFLEFQRHFGHLVICSSSTPYKVINEEEERKYAKKSSPDDIPHGGTLGNDVPEATSQKPTVDYVGQPGMLELPLINRAKDKRGSIEVTVQESKSTIKLNTVEKIEMKTDSGESRTSLFVRRSRSVKEVISKNSKGELCTTDIGSPMPTQQRGPRDDLSGKQVPLFKKMSTSADHVTSSQKRHGSDAGGANKKGDGGSVQGAPLGRGPSVTSILSNCSNASSASDSESTYSASEIKIKLKCTNSKNKSERPYSAPVVSRANSLHSTSSKTSIFESRMDYFRSHGSWRELVVHFGRWSNALDTCGGPASDIDSHAKNTRIVFALTKPDTVNEITPNSLHGKGHVIISLMQDYRRGARTSNSMLVNIGFCLYKSKNPEKDEKRHLGNLQLIADVRSDVESREITRRFDLDLGCYLMVPYTYQAGQEGEFLARILCEKVPLDGKTGCTIS